jgi:N-acetylmuramoyl-L-alanine amidase
MLKQNVPTAALVLAQVFVQVPARAASAAPPPRTLYHAALAREQTVRDALTAPDAGPAVLSEVHAVVAAYESIVRRYPASGYSDNALWQAGRLLLDAYTRLGQPQDREAGVRLLKRLAAAYPTSKLVKRVPAALAQAGAEAGPPGPEKAPSRIATIRSITRSVLPDAVRVTIELDAEVPFREERIPDPERVFLDLPATRAAPALVDQTIRFDADADVVHQIRIGRHPNNTTRVVLDAAGVASYSVYPLYGPYRLVVDCMRPGTATTTAGAGAGRSSAAGAATAPAATSGSSAATRPRAGAVRAQPPVLPARFVAPAWQRTAPAVAPQHGVLLAEAHAPAADVVTEAARFRGAPTAPPPAPSPSAATAALPAPPAPATPPAPAVGSSGPLTPPTAPQKNSSGGFSIARQLGLGVSRIVIDPGHGGHDPGAKGKGVNEAELVLDVALRLEKLLQKIPGVEVILTRRTDDFVPLQERTLIANREGADLFLSIHANASSSSQARGVETYFLNFADNLSAAAVAARENAASGQAMGALPDFVKAIALNNKLAESRDFATEVQRAMIQHLRSPNKTVKDLGVKQAPFVVLIGAAMPSVLAEISFVTNVQEARLLKGSAYRQRIAEALLSAVRKYQTSLKNAQIVAPE